MEEHLKGLNSMQREAAMHKDGPLLIVAGAGAGKTKTITHRIVNLIKEGVAPEKILAVTFTNKAAKEMRERVVAEIEKNTKGQNTLPFISTFHSLGVYIIKENARILGLTKYFTILDEGDTTTLIKDTIKEIGLDPKQYDPRRIKNIISREKGKFTEMTDYVENSTDPASDGASFLGKIVAQVWQIYENKKIKENSLDFDDLLLKATKLLKENEVIRKIYQEKWEYIHIDEYQDTNEVQYLMARLLAGEKKNICVVGDADQNIYSWRGANLKNILNFEKDYPGAKIILLEENYRSTKNILETASCSDPVLPTQLFEAGANLLLFIALALLYRRTRGRRGLVTAAYLMAYPVIRFLIEPLRGDVRQTVWNWSIGQFISMLLFAIGACLLAWRLRTPVAPEKPSASPKQS